MGARATMCPSFATCTHWKLEESESVQFSSISWIPVHQWGPEDRGEGIERMVLAVVLILVHDKSLCRRFLPVRHRYRRNLI